MNLCWFFNSKILKDYSLGEVGWRNFRAISKLSVQPLAYQQNLAFLVFLIESIFQVIVRELVGLVSMIPHKSTMYDSECILQCCFLKRMLVD